MNPSPAQQQRLFTIMAYLRRLSIRRKITIAILLTFVLTLPSVAMSLMYFSRILQEINTIIEQDVALGRHASDMSVIMLDIRRNERNYRLIGSDAERESVRALIDRLRVLVGEADSLAPDADTHLIDDLSACLTRYENNFNLLVEHVTEHPPGAMVDRMRTQFAQRLEDFQQQYQDALIELETAKPSERDSLLALVTGSLDAISYDRLIGDSAGNEGDAQPMYIERNLNQSQQAFLDAAQILADKSWENMNEHRSASLHIEARAKRNIITVMILTGLLCLYVVISLPRKIMRPITRLNALLKKTGEGDYRSHARIYTDDEIGDLAHSYNLVLERISRYDELKTKKIASQKRMIERLLENLSMPVCLMSSGLVLLYYNAPFAELFGGTLPPKPPDTGIGLEKSEVLRSLYNELQRAMDMPSNELAVEFDVPSGVHCRFRGRIIRNTLMKLESIILVDAGQTASAEGRG